MTSCNLFSQPACLFDVLVTASDFPIDEGPQIDVVLVFQDWRFTAQEDICTDRINAQMHLEDAMGVVATSATLDLPKTTLCPMLCPSS